jgi:hypothetical protein
LLAEAHGAPRCHSVKLKFQFQRIIPPLHGGLSEEELSAWVGTMGRKVNNAVDLPMLNEAGLHSC